MKLSYGILNFVWFSVIITQVFTLNYRLPNTTIPYHYDMDLEVKLEPEFNFNGNVSIDLVVHNTTNVLVLHSDELTIDKMNSYLLDKQRNKVHYFRIASYENRTNMLTLKFETPLLEGMYTLRLKFDGEISKGNSGLYRTFYHPEKNTTRWFAVTQFEPLGARRMFPCFDEPQFRATFELRVIHPGDRHAVSNTEITNVMHVGQRTMTAFRRTPSMPTYLMALAITDYDHVESVLDNKIYRIFVEPKLINYTQFAQNATITAMPILEKVTGVNYALNKLDQIVVEVFPGGMENWGLVVYGDSIVHQPNKTNDRKKERSLVLICHELAHQWFGNLVTLKWWSYTWLNEGFATYFSHICVDGLDKSLRIMDKHVVQEIRRVMNADSQLDLSKSLNHYVEKSFEIDSKFDSFSYTKGSAIIRTMAASFNHFNESITNYLRTNAYLSATPDDLYNSFQALNTFPPGGSAAKIWSTWTDQPGYPMITLNIDYQNNVGTIEQNRFLLLMGTKKSEEKWWIPISMTTEKNSNFNETMPIEWVQPNSQTTKIEIPDTSGWVILNIQQTVYCRVNYNLENWNRIINHLNSSEFDKIHSLNRGQLIDDSMSLARAGYIPYSVPLDMSTYLNKEKDPTIWFSAYPNFAFLNNVLYGTEIHHKFNVYVANLINSAAKNTQLRTVEKEMNLNRDYVSEFSKKFLKIKSKSWKGKRKQLTKTFSILSDNIFTKNDYMKVEKIFANKVDTMDEMESEMSQMTLKKIDQNILYKQYWIEKYYKDVSEWFMNH